MFKLVKVDTGRCIVVYQTTNANNETIYYGLMESFGIQFVRCSQPFKEYGEKIYEPQSEATPKSMIEIELPKGNSLLESKVKEFISNNPLMKGIKESYG
jgi:hypothetical protein